MDRGHDPIHVLLRLFSNNFLESLKHLDNRFDLSKEHIRCTLHLHEIGKVQVRVPPRFKVPPQSVKHLGDIPLELYRLLLKETEKVKTNVFFHCDNI